MTGEFLSRRRRRAGGGYRPMSDINVTPFVDVMLVLLIVFMVTAPLLTVGVPVDLPKTKAKALSQPEEPLVISINASGVVFIQETEVELDNLVPRLAAITENKPDTRIYLRGDRAVDYGRIMEVMTRVNTAGFTHLALVSELPRKDAAKKEAASN
ncbi:MAG: protein TolR [Rhodospirillales bacterium]|nr:protein TolR [Rhodospirillales bacterium]